MSTWVVCADNDVPQDATPVTRWVGLDQWIDENAGWLRWATFKQWYPASDGTTHWAVSGPDNPARWIRRHEARLTLEGVVFRKGRAWRLACPGAREALHVIMNEEIAAKRARGAKPKRLAA